MIVACLCIAVLSAWLAAAGFVRLSDPLDRLHCVTFLTVTAGGAILLAALFSDGLADRPGKIALLVVLSLLNGAAGAHAVGRAAMIRRGKA